MKLHNVVVEGRFCGLDTVDQCVANYYLHYPYALPVLAWEYETAELDRELKAYERGELELNWGRIEDEVEQMHKDFEELCDKGFKELDAALEILQ